MAAMKSRLVRGGGGVDDVVPVLAGVTWCFTVARREPAPVTVRAMAMEPALRLVDEPFEGLPHGADGSAT
jgi:hypothetical protein